MSAQTAVNLNLALGGFIAAIALCAGLLGIARSLAKDSEIPFLIGHAMLLYAPMEVLSAVNAAGIVSGGGAASTGLGSRFFLAFALVGGTVLLGARRASDSSMRFRAGVSLMVAMVFGILLWAIEQGGASLGLSVRLVPLLGFLMGGLIVFPRLYLQKPSPLSLALLLVTVPLVILELEANFMVSESTGIDYWIAHTQKLFAVGILFLGLVIDYLSAQKREEAMTRDLRSFRELVNDQEKVVASVRTELDRGETARHILEQAVGAIDLGVTVVDMEGKILYVNKAEARMHGYTPSELLGQSIRVYDGTSSATEPPGPPILRKWERESANIRKDGTRFPVRLRSEPVLARDGSAIGLLTVCEDISEKDAADRLKEDFLATVSHELRTPLTAIIASLHLLDLEGLPADRVPKLLDMTKRNSERLLRLIGDLLDLQKLRAGKMVFRSAPCEAGEVIKSVIAETGVLAEARGLTIEHADLPEDILVLADPQRLHQVLVNLLSNAIKFSPDGGRIRVAINSEEQGVRFSVEDQGPGIPEERLESLFEPFAHTRSIPDAGEPGSGLGLAIVRQLLDGMNGSVTVDTKMGEGTTVQVRLPHAS